MEKRIASYQEPGIRLQLVKIYDLVEQIKHNENFEPIKTGNFCENNVHFQIRKNRKVLCNFKWEGPARTRLATMIVQELQQLNIFSKYEEEKQ